MTRLRAFGQTTFRSLSIRNYRLFFLGQLVSLCGTWMQQIAQDWLVIRLGGKGVSVGFTTALQFLPMLLFGMWGGLIADRFDKRKVLIGTQIAAAVLAVVLGVLVATGAVQLWMVFGLAFLLGMVTAVDTPTRQAFVTEMVGPDEITNAVGLNSAVFNAARVAGPAIAGVVIEFVGLSPAFFANAVSFVAPMIALSLMDPDALFRRAPAPREPGQLRAGLRYVWATPELRSPIVLLAVVATFSINLSVLFPLLARFSFHGGPTTYSLLVSSMAAGALLGALTAARRAEPSDRLRVGTVIAFGVLSIVVALAPSAPLAAIALVPTGTAVMLFMAMSNSTVQLRSHPGMRGRVMALYALVFLGSTPIGGPLLGWISEQWNPRLGLGLGGAIAVIAGGVAWLALQRTTAAGAADDLLLLAAASE